MMVEQAQAYNEYITPLLKVRGTRVVLKQLKSGEEPVKIPKYSHLEANLEKVKGAVASQNVDDLKKAIPEYVVDLKKIYNFLAEKGIVEEFNHLDPSSENYFSELFSKTDGDGINGAEMDSMYKEGKNKKVDKVDIQVVEKEDESEYIKFKYAQDYKCPACGRKKVHPPKITEEQLKKIYPNGTRTYRFIIRCPETGKLVSIDSDSNYYLNRQGGPVLIDDKEAIPLISIKQKFGPPQLVPILADSEKTGQVQKAENPNENSKKNFFKLIDGYSIPGDSGNHGTEK